MKDLKDESGQALIFTALCLTAVLGAMALAVDVSYLHYRQSQLQTAADSAALAAGLEIGACANTVCPSMKTAAAKALIEEGITTATISPTANQCTISSSSGLAMAINVAPCVIGAGDPNNGNTHIAEVVLTQPQSTFFASMFGISIVNLRARAEAGDSWINTAAQGGNCVYTKNLVFNSSDGNFHLSNCSLFDDGNLQTDSGDTVTASTFLYYGTWSPNNCNASCSWTLGSSETQPTHTTTPQSDPLAGLTPPTQPANSTTSNNTTPSSGATLQPGYYPNGVNLNSGVSVSLAPGLYYMNGSINVDTGSTLTGTGVTLYFVNGTLQMNTNSTVQLSALPTSTNGQNANMLVWEAPSNGSGMPIDTGTSSYFNGVIYLPTQQLTFNSGSGVTVNANATATALDAASIMVDDGENFKISNSGGYLGGSPGQTLGTFGLAE